MKKTITLFIFALLISSCAEKPKYSIDDYSTLKGLSISEVDSVIGKPEVVKNIDGFKVYIYKQILVTNFREKCDLSLYFDGLKANPLAKNSSDKLSGDFVYTIKTSSCKDSNKDLSLENSKTAYNLGYDAAISTAAALAEAVSNLEENFGDASLPDQKKAAAEVEKKVLLAMYKGYIFSKEDWVFFVRGSKDGFKKRKRYSFTPSNKDKSLEESKRAYNLGYDDGRMAYGLPASQRASPFEVHMAKGYNFSKLDYNVYVMGYNDGQFGKKRKY